MMNDGDKRYNGKAQQTTPARLTQSFPMSCFILLDSSPLSMPYAIYQVSRSVHAYSAKI